MQQERFESLHQQRWQEFARWLRSKKKSAAQTLAAGEIPRRYRELCQQLTLARDRQYGSAVVDRIHGLVLAGHQLLYARKGSGLAAMFSFIRNDFPTQVRSRWRSVISASALLFIPMLVMIIVLQRWPDFVNYLVDPDTLAELQRMYDPAAEHIGRPRGADSHVAAFGMYVWNNVRIDFQCFAGGLLFGVGAIFFLLFNGVYIGAIAGYLTQLGYVETFWGFVSGHSAFELIGAALSGAAGLEVGMALIAPGRLSRVEALKQRTRSAIKMVYGAAGMTIIAAFIEAFWSSLPGIPLSMKYAVGIALWVLLAAYFLFVGRDTPFAPSSARRGTSSQQKAMPPTVMKERNAA